MIGQGEAPVDVTVAQVAEHASSFLVVWSDKFLAVGKQLAVGLSLMAVVGSFLVYVGVLLIWRMFVTYEWRRRHHPH